MTRYTLSDGYLYMTVSIRATGRVAERYRLPLTFVRRWCPPDEPEIELGAEWEKLAREEW